MSGFVWVSHISESDMAETDELNDVSQALHGSGADGDAGKADPSQAEPDPVALALALALALAPAPAPALALAPVLVPAPALALALDLPQAEPYQLPGGKRGAGEGLERNLLTGRESVGSSKSTRC